MDEWAVLAPRGNPAGLRGAMPDRDRPLSPTVLRIPLAVRLDYGFLRRELEEAMEVVCASCSARNRVPAKRLLDKAKCAQCKGALLPLSRPVALASAQDFDELVRDSPLPVLVDFWAAWCGPCRMVGPEVEKLARERTERLLVAKVDTEALPSVAQRFEIRSIPTMILFRGGAEARRLSGAMPAAEISRQLAL